MMKIVACVARRTQGYIYNSQQGSLKTWLFRIVKRGWTNHNMDGLDSADNAEAVVDSNRNSEGVSNPAALGTDCFYFALDDLNYGESAVADAIDEEPDGKWDQEWESNVSVLATRPAWQWGHPQCVQVYLHSEIDGLRPADVARLLQLSENEVALAKGHIKKMLLEEGQRVLAAHRSPK